MLIYKLKVCFAGFKPDNSLAATEGIKLIFPLTSIRKVLCCSNQVLHADCPIIMMMVKVKLNIDEDNSITFLAIGEHVATSVLHDTALRFSFDELKKIRLKNIGT